VLYKEIPFTGYCIALIAGILCGSYMNSLIYSNAVYIVTTAVLVSIILIRRHLRSSLLFGLLVHCCIISLGCSLSLIKKSKNKYISGESHSFIVKTDDYPSHTAKSLKINVFIERVDNDSGHKGNRLLVYTDERFISPDLKPGNILSLASYPVEITDFDSTDNFDYRLFMNRRGYRYCIFCYDSIAIRGHRPGLKHKALIIRRQLMERLENSLDTGKSLAVVSAMTLGYRKLIDDEIKTVFRKSGIIHIMAVSGLHVGIVSLIVLSLFKIIRLRSGIMKLIISLIIIWLYALLTGLSPSVTRASVMFSFLSIGYIIYRPAKPLNSVMASAFIILIINPSMIYEPSFLLSYAAVISIVINYKDLVEKINIRGRLPASVWKILVVSVLAQAGTLPFVALFFGEVPMLSILTNLFAIPLASGILVLGFSLILTAELPLIPDILSSIINYCVDTLTDISGSIASFDAVVSLDALSPVRAVILFFILMILLRYILNAERRNPHLLMSFSILYFIIP